MRYPCLHCQPLKVVWEGVDPGSTHSSHSEVLHAPELTWVGPAFPPGAQSLVQAVTEHFHYTQQPLLVSFCHTISLFTAYIDLLFPILDFCSKLEVYLQKRLSF